MTTNRIKQLADFLHDVQHDYIGAGHSELCGSYLDFDADGLAVAILQYLDQMKAAQNK